MKGAYKQAKAFPTVCFHMRGSVHAQKHQGSTITLYDMMQSVSAMRCNAVNLFYCHVTMPSTFMMDAHVSLGIYACND